MERTDPIIREMQAQADAVCRLLSAPGGLEKWIGRMVKIGFDRTADDRVIKEWMWVEVGTVRGGKLVGVLGNIPMFTDHVHHGGEVVFAEDEIVGLSE